LILALIGALGIAGIAALPWTEADARATREAVVILWMRLSVATPSRRE
jgi:hypothetical protein